MYMVNDLPPLADHRERLKMKVWKGSPPKRCDICSTLLDREFFDARSYQGRWGNFCRSCFHVHTPGKLGVGMGQRYVLVKDEAAATELFQQRAEVN